MAFTVSILYGSTRDKRVGIRVVRFLQRALEARGLTVHVIDPMETPLPFLNKMYKEYAEGEAPPNMQAISEKLSASDGFVIASGEYNHSLPPALKNLLDHFQREYFFKPAGICSYSAGPFGGVRASVHLRDIMSELGMASIPVVFPVSKVSKAFDEEGNALEEAYDRRVGRFLDELVWYMEALSRQRATGTPY